MIAMANMNNEQKLINDLLKKNASLSPTPLKILSSCVAAKKNCDVQFIGTIPGRHFQKHFCLEAKSDKSTNKSNNVLLIFGDIVKNRKLNGMSRVSYGALLEYHSSEGMKSFFIDQIQKYIDSRDWNKFGSTYGCNYIFFYDDSTHELFYSKWKGFVTAKSIKKWF